MLRHFLGIYHGSMNVRQAADPSAFLTATRDLLLEDEARHNLLLGIAGTLGDHPGVYREHRLWVVEDDGLVVGAALRTPPTTSSSLVLAQTRRSSPSPTRSTTCTFQA